MNQELPVYLEKYLEQKFSDLTKEIQSSASTSDYKFNLHSGRLDKVEEGMDWAHQKIWMAMGGIAVLGVAGAIAIFGLKAELAGAYRQVSASKAENTVTIK